MHAVMVERTCCTHSRRTHSKLTALIMTTTPRTLAYGVRGIFVVNLDRRSSSDA